MTSPRRGASIAWCLSRCSSTCAIGRRCSSASHDWLHAGRALLYAHLLPPLDALCLRRPGTRRLDEPAFLHRRHDAQRRPATVFPGAPANFCSAGAGTDATTATPRMPGWPTWIRRRDEVLAAAGKRVRRRPDAAVGGSAGACSSWPVPNCSATTRPAVVGQPLPVRSDRGDGSRQRTDTVHGMNILVQRSSPSSWAGSPACWAAPTSCPGWARWWRH